MENYKNKSCDYRMTILILYLDSQVSDEKSMYNSISQYTIPIQNTIYLLTYYAASPQRILLMSLQCV